MSIPNVVSYELVHTGDGLPRILIDSLRSESGSAEHTTSFSPAPEPGTKEIHIFLYSVPPTEAEAIENRGRALFFPAAQLNHDVRMSSDAEPQGISGNIQSQVSANFDNRPAYRSRAHHYRAYYNLIGARLWNRRTEPRFLMPIQDTDGKPIDCSLQLNETELTKAAVHIFSAGSYSCLVAAGTPVQ